MPSPEFDGRGLSTTTGRRPRRRLRYVPWQCCARRIRRVSASKIRAPGKRQIDRLHEACTHALARARSTSGTGPSGAGPLFGLSRAPAPDLSQPVEGRRRYRIVMAAGLEGRTGHACRGSAGPPAISVGAILYWLMRSQHRGEIGMQLALRTRGNISRSFRTTQPWPRLRKSSAPQVVDRHRLAVERARLHEGRSPSFLI